MPELGRFNQPDSIIPEQQQGTIAWDRHAGLNNNPVRFVDPSGHWTCGDYYDPACAENDEELAAYTQNTSPSGPPLAPPSDTTEKQGFDPITPVTSTPPYYYWSPSPSPTWSAATTDTPPPEEQVEEPGKGPSLEEIIAYLKMLAISSGMVDAAGDLAGVLLLMKSIAPSPVTDALITIIVEALKAGNQLDIGKTTLLVGESLAIGFATSGLAFAGALFGGTLGFGAGAALGAVAFGGATYIILQNFVDQLNKKYLFSYFNISP